MKYLTQCALSIKGSRVERGTEVELSEKEAARYAQDLVPVAEAFEPEPEADEEEVSLDDMTAIELKEKAGELGLSTSGTKADLIERISLHIEGGGEEED